MTRLQQTNAQPLAISVSTKGITTPEILSSPSSWTPTPIKCTQAGVARSHDQPMSASHKETTTVGQSEALEREGVHSYLHSLAQTAIALKMVSARWTWRPTGKQRQNMSNTLHSQWRACYSDSQGPKDALEATPSAAPLAERCL